MTGFRGWTENGQIIDDLTPETLRPLLLSASTFVEVDHPGRGADVAARADKTGPGRWQVQLSPNDGGRPVRTDEVNTDAAFDILRSWAAGDDWWRDAFSWTPLSR